MKKAHKPTVFAKDLNKDIAVRAKKGESLPHAKSRVAKAHEIGDVNPRYNRNARQQAPGHPAASLEQILMEQAEREGQSLSTPFLSPLNAYNDELIKSAINDVTHASALLTAVYRHGARGEAAYYVNKSINFADQATSYLANAHVQGSTTHLHKSLFLSTLTLADKATHTAIHHHTASNLIKDKLLSYLKKAEHCLNRSIVSVSGIVVKGEAPKYLTKNQEFSGY